jgi:hypothetical protein
VKLFICWAGELSRKIALILYDWIPAVIPSITPWISSEDIRKGTRWSAELSKELEGSYFGIICLVPDNLMEPWLLFEAGALSKSVEGSRVFPLLFGVGPSQLPGPLQQFQATIFEKEDVRKLMQSLNEQFGQPSVPPEQLTRFFNHSWLSLEAQVAALLKEITSFPSKAVNGTPAAADAAAISKEALTILKLMSEGPNETFSAESLSAVLQLPVAKAQYHLDVLQEQGYIEMMMFYEEYFLSSKGRALLVEKGLL